MASDAPKDASDAAFKIAWSLMDVATISPHDVSMAAKPIIDALLAAERARVVEFCDEFETKALRQSAKETGHYNDARFFDGRASAFRAVMLMLEDDTAAARGTTREGG